MSAAAVPNCRAFDPAFACELAVIIEYGMERMLDEKQDEFFYITVMNENYAQPSLPDGAREHVVKGMYHLEKNGDETERHVRLLGSGTILMEVIAAAELLLNEYGISSDVYSATSFTELGVRPRRLSEQTD